MAEVRAQRRLAAILAADVVGFSRLMETDEAGTLAALKARRRDVLNPLVTMHQGRIFKTTGDGVLVEFASAVNAVQCAVDLQQGMAAANGSHPEDRHIVLRIGVNLGDVMVEGSDLYGDGVNIAARLEAIAEPGAILVSSTAHDYVRNKVKVGFADLGSQNLKNIVEPVRTYRVTATPVVALAPVKATADRSSIAVLPFANMSGVPEQEYFSDGITEDIITELSRFRSLFVIARNSSFQYRDKAVDVRRVARELGVRYVLEGSVRKFANRVRITAQLIDATTGNHLWSERYDRPLEDVFVVEDDVVRTIVATLAGRLEDAEVSAALRKPTGNLAAYDALLRGVEHLRGYAADDNKRARELFEQAVALDPRFALAHAYLGLALVVEHGYADAPEAIKRQALDATLVALRLDPGDARCHLFVGLIYMYRGEHELALHHLERSNALNPNDANCLSAVGSALGLLGRAEEGAELVRRAMRLNPFHPQWYWDDLAIVLYAAHRYEEAIEANLRITARKKPWHHARLAACYAQLGRLEEARVQVAEVLRMKPDFHLSNVDRVYKNSADAEHVLEGMRKAGLPE